MKNDVQLAEIFYRKQMSHSAFISSQIVIALQAIDLAGPYSSGTNNRTKCALMSIRDHSSPIHQKSPSPDYH